MCAYDEDDDGLLEDLDCFTPEERRMLIMIGVWAILFAALGYGITCLVLWGMTGKVIFTDPYYSDAITVATIAFGISGGWFGWMRNR